MKPGSEVAIKMKDTEVTASSLAFSVRHSRLPPKKELANLLEELGVETAKASECLDGFNLTMGNAADK